MRPVGELCRASDPPDEVVLSARADDPFILRLAAEAHSYREAMLVALDLVRERDDELRRARRTIDAQREEIRSLARAREKNP